MPSRLRDETRKRKIERRTRDVQAGAGARSPSGALFTHNVSRLDRSAAPRLFGLKPGPSNHPWKRPPRYINSWKRRPRPREEAVIRAAVQGGGKKP